MSSPPEPSILEYARFHEIAISSIPNPLLLVSPVIEDIDQSLRDISNHPSINLEDIHQEIQARTQEKLDVNWASAPLLSSIIKLSVDERPTGNQYEEIECPTDSHRIRDMKMEAPVLRTDHEMDMRAFRRRISLDFTQIYVPLEHLDDENDESVNFPKSFWSQAEDLWHTAQGERLSCIKDGLLLMQGIKSEVMASAAGHVDNWLNDGIIFRSKSKDRDPLTPILLPRNPTPVPFLPSSPCLEMEILLDAETPPMAEDLDVERIEDTHVANCDRIVTDFISGTDGAGNPERRACGSNRPSPPYEDLALSPNVQNRILDFKVDPPITPPVSTEKRPAEDDEDILKFMARTGVVPEITSQDAMEIESGDLVEEALVEIVNAAKRKAEDELKAERIRGIRTMTRCKVPLLSPPIIVPPWLGVAGLSESELKGLYRSFISETKTEALAGLRYSIGADDRKNDLKWRPFAMEIRRLEINENMTPEDSSSGLLREIGRHLSGSEIEDETPQVVCHYDFHLSSLDDNEELSPRTVYEEVGSVSPLQIKGCEYGTGKYQGKGGSSGYSPPDKQQGIQNMVANPNVTNIEMNVESAEATLVGSGMTSTFSPLDSLSNFMKVRGQRTTTSSSDKCPYFVRPTLPDPPTLAQDDRTSKISTQIPVRIAESTVTTPSLPLLTPPSTTRPPGVLTFVLSTSLLRTHCAVIHNLESLSPACNLIFRDNNTLPNIYPTDTRAESFHRPRLIQTPQFPNSPENNQGQEADISFSPTAGAILTTTQEITQKYLPGQQPSGQGIAQELNYPVRRRISDICLLYEELYVFICIPISTRNKSNSTVPHADMELDNREVQAIESLRTFCVSFSHFSTINVLPVMNDASNITNWLVSLANKHYTMTPWSTPDAVHELDRPGNVPFPADPSPNEHFLRQSGLNTFAAQMVLLHSYRDGNDDGVLYYSGGYPTQGTQNPQAALSRFVCMNPFERQSIFTAILGKRVVERVERRLAVEEGRI
ncbi:hypothetical protein ACJ73_03888 [Blastomyces percursus]|uniref:Uncharacterized protein n=1 Tax=Blastomyces percursus TaxID=1658174 RepID=A0A1J9QWY6_9EURO|nr:hypothetical protein ACJ73_03888 [Blastomyces percursus]